MPKKTPPGLSSNTTCVSGALRCPIHTSHRYSDTISHLGGLTSPIGSLGHSQVVYNQCDMPGEAHDPVDFTMHSKPNPNPPLVILCLFSLLIPAFAWTDTCRLTYATSYPSWGTTIVPSCSPSSTCSVVTTTDSVGSPSPLCVRTQSCSLITTTSLVPGGTTTTVGCNPTSSCSVSMITSGGDWGTTTFPTCKPFLPTPPPNPVPTPTPPPPGVPMWGQCGGLNWTGPTVCVPDAKCVIVVNPYYSELRELSVRPR